MLTAVVVSKHIAKVSAKDKATGKDQSMTMASSSGLSDKNIEKMLLMLNKPKLIRASQGLEEGNKADSTVSTVPGARPKIHPQVKILPRTAKNLNKYFKADLTTFLSNSSLHPSLIFSTT